MIPNGYLIFEDESFLDSTVAKMNALRKSGQFCDVRLQVGLANTPEPPAKNAAFLQGYRSSPVQPLGHEEACFSLFTFLRSSLFSAFMSLLNNE